MKRALARFVAEVREVYLAETGPLGPDAVIGSSRAGYRVNPAVYGRGHGRGGFNASFEAMCLAYNAEAYGIAGFEVELVNAARGARLLGPDESGVAIATVQLTVLAPDSNAAPWIR